VATVFVQLTGKIQPDDVSGGPKLYLRGNARSEVQTNRATLGHIYRLLQFIANMASKILIYSIRLSQTVDNLCDSLLTLSGQHELRRTLSILAGVNIWHTAKRLIMDQILQSTSTSGIWAWKVTNNAGTRTRFS
jgi:hypothetical protein